MSGHPGSEATGLPPPVVRVDDALRPLALARLLGVRPGDAAVKQFISNAAAERTDLRSMWATLNAAGRPVHVVLFIASPGRTAMVFMSGDDVVGVRAAGELSRLAGAGAIRERATLLEHVVGVISGRIDEPDVPERGRLALAQALLEPTNVELIESLRLGGFTQLAYLAYMRREIPRRNTYDEPVWPASVSVIPLSELPPAKADTALRRALTRSYENTLDCPALCDLRTLDDVIDSHRSVGHYDPRLWYLLMIDGEAEGCMLLSECPGQQTVELVYIGLGAAARGKGLAASLLKQGINRLSGRADKWLACAVDEANAPALRLYHSLRFRSFTKRVAFVRGLSS